MSQLREKRSGWAVTLLSIHLPPFLDEHQAPRRDRQRSQQRQQRLTWYKAPTCSSEAYGPQVQQQAALQHLAARARGRSRFDDRKRCRS